MARRISTDHQARLPDALDAADRSLSTAIARLEYLDGSFSDEASEIAEGQWRIEATLTLLAALAARLSEKTAALSEEVE